MRVYYLIYHALGDTHSRAAQSREPACLSHMGIFSICIYTSSFFLIINCCIHLWCRKESRGQKGKAHYQNYLSLFTRKTTAFLDASLNSLPVELQRPEPGYLATQASKVLGNVCSTFNNPEALCGRQKGRLYICR